MASPFPGMDPYLERFWNDVQASLSVYIADRLNEILPDCFRATLREQSIFSSIDRPDPPMRAGLAVRSDPFTQYSIEIVALTPEEKAVTGIEVLHPENKQSGDGMRKFEEKQEDYRRAKVSRVNIDLLREGHRFFEFPARLLKPEQVKPYYVTIYRADKPGECEFYAIDLRDPLPVIGIPLRPEDPDVQLDLQPLIQHVYRTGRFPIDYDEPCDPPLKGEDATWARELLAKPPQ